MRNIIPYITECPRDAMQGIQEFIPTDKKISYLQSLLDVGFDCLDFGSFVSPKAIPQLSDTSDVLDSLDVSNTNTSLLAITANLRGVEEAVEKDKIDFIGFPLSINETFQYRNTNKSIAQSLVELESIAHICRSNDKKLVVYLSMAFGNPYGDVHNPDMINEMTKKLIEIGTHRIMLSDTIGVADTVSIEKSYSSIKEHEDNIAIGMHLHSDPNTASNKVLAALETGCQYYDGAILGIGGCPMAKDELVGNIPTEIIIATLKKKSAIFEKINEEKFELAVEQARSFFNK